ncbi:hypothetical protein VTK26DRAFT_6072 [Humicola hyalothermophila]
MRIRSHGISRSLSSSNCQLIIRRRLRHSYVQASSCPGILERSCRRRVFTSTRSRSVLCQSRSRMGTGKTTQQVWNVSLGIVFAGDTRMVSPRLSLAPYHNEPVSVTAEEGPAGLPKCDASNQVTAGQDAGNSRKEVVAAPTPVSVAPTASAGVTEAASPGKGLEDAAALIPPFTPLDFKIPDRVFRDAKLAEEGTPQSFWNYTMYRGPGEDGSLSAKVKVHYCTSPHTTERTLKQYFVGEKILGFDLEWAGDAQKSQGPRKNVSLVQLATPSRIGLFHLAAYAQYAPLVTPTLKQILEDPEVTKLGVWIKGDCTRLSTYLGINARGIFELSHLYKLVKYSSSGEYNLINKKIVSLANQAKDCLGLPLFKGSHVRASDWSQPLRMDQIMYSASDAYAAIQIFATLNHQRENLNPTPPLPHHAELNLPIRLAEGVLKTPTTKEQEADADDAAEEKPVATEGSEALPAIAPGTINMSVTLEPEDDNPPSPPSPATGPAPTTETAIATTTATTTTSPSTETKNKHRTSTIATTTTTASPSPKPPTDARVVEASLWAAQFRLAHPKTRAAPCSLRAYYLWHHHQHHHHHHGAGLPPTEVAALLRDPPLQPSTVATYILDAIRLGRLPFERRRLRDEVLGLMDEAVLAGWRYEAVVRACEEREEEEEGGVEREESKKGEGVGLG